MLRLVLISVTALGCRAPGTSVPVVAKSLETSPLAMRAPRPCAKLDNTLPPVEVLESPQASSFAKLDVLALCLPGRDELAFGELGEVHTFPVIGQRDETLQVVAGGNVFELLAFADLASALPVVVRTTPIVAAFDTKCPNMQSDIEHATTFLLKGAEPEPWLGAPPCRGVVGVRYHVNDVQRFGWIDAKEIGRVYQGDRDRARYISIEMPRIGDKLMGLELLSAPEVDAQLV